MSTSTLPPTLQDPTTWAEARALFRADFSRWVQWLGGGSAAQKAYWFCLPSVQALLWFRVARCLFLKGHRNSARLISLISLYLTRIEIPPTSSIGPGCIIPHAEGVIVCGRLGARATLSGSCGIGGGAREGDVGGGPGLPWVGDDVFFGQGAVVLGALRVGHGVVLGACTLTLDDVPDRATVIAPVATEEPSCNTLDPARA
jgi:serine O-acetyltransferase